jgi:hypothetical protein
MPKENYPNSLEEVDIEMGQKLLLGDLKGFNYLQRRVEDLKYSKPSVDLSKVKREAGRYALACDVIHSVFNSPSLPRRVPSRR